MSNINVNNLTPLAGTTGTVSVSGSLHVSGNLSANGTLTLGNENTDNILLNAELSSSLVPDKDDVFDIGSSAKQWKDLYVDGTAYIDSASIDVLYKAHSNVQASSSLLPTNDDSFNLGSSTLQWKDLYVDGTAYIDSASIQVLYPRTYAGQTFVRVSGSMYPEKTGEFALGVRGGGVTLSRLWKGIHAVTASFDNVSSSLIPDQDDTYDLGSAGYEWRNLYIDGTAHIDTLNATTLTATSGTFSYVSGSSPVYFAANVLPDTTQTFTLGHRGGGSLQQYRKLWKGIHAVTASFDNVSSSLSPDQDNTYDLGKVGWEWRNLYIDGTANIDTLTADTITNVNTTHVTASGDVSSSGVVYGGTVISAGNMSFSPTGQITGGNIITYGTTQLGNSYDDTHTFTGDITASRHISSSAGSTGSFGAFKSYGGFQFLNGLPSNPAGLATGSLWASGSEIINGQAHATIRIKI
tara:strand:- start:668 stop:2062 length:1395 start_codon:yes stop_codon:yes gene_type:complete